MFTISIIICLSGWYKNRIEGSGTQETIIKVHQVASNVMIMMLINSHFDIYIVKISNNVKLVLFSYIARCSTLMREQFV